MYWKTKSMLFATVDKTTKGFHLLNKKYFNIFKFMYLVKLQE